MNLGVLISGRGSNLGAVLAASAGGDLGARVALVVSNKADAPGLARAAAAGVPTRVIPHTSYPDRASFDAALVEALREASVDTVVLAGFMRLLTPVFLDAFPDRVVNIHPSLLPAFPGLDAQQQAFDYGVQIAGCTVHFVDEHLDSGVIILQRAIPVLPTDDAPSLATRILAEEHQAYSEAIARVASGEYEIQGRRYVKRA
jgi:phosphoribosylglycinamide formyltransferase-1